MERPDREDLSGLRRKYERLLALRRIHARAREDASFVEPDPRAEMIDLADRFPGSLRELDALPFDVIVARIDRIRAAEHDPAYVADWMLAQVVFHEHARGALAIKRWLDGKKVLTPSTRAAYRAWLEALDPDAEARLFADDLDAIAKPPRGRLTNAVHARVGAVLALPAHEVRQLVFGTGLPEGTR